MCLAPADGAKIEFAGIGLPDDFLRAGNQVLPGHDGVQGAFPEGLIGANLVSARDPLIGVVRADEARQTHGAAEARKYTEFDFGKADDGAFCADAEIGGDSKFEAAAKGKTVNRRHGGERQVFDGVEYLVAFLEPGEQSFSRPH